MIAAQRRNLIVEFVTAHGAASLGELVERLDASPVTVRRDLDYLHRLGLVERTRGGAIAGSQAAESPYSEKTATAMPEKTAIGRAAAELVEDGAVLAIGPGTTTEALATALRDRTGLTVVTNSLPVALAFGNSPQNDVVLTGGALRGSIRALVGDAAVRTFRGLHADLAFMSGNGLDPGFGLSTPNVLVAEADRAIAACARRLAVLVDHTKLGVRTAIQTVAVGQISDVVTDAASDDGILRELEAGGIAVHVAR